MRDQPNGQPLTYSASIKNKRELQKLHRMKLCTLKRLKSGSPKWSNLFSAGRRLKPAGEYYCQQRSVTLLALINLPFSHFPLIKNNYLYSCGLLLWVFFFLFLFFSFTFLSIAVISCLLTHRLHVIYRHPNGRPSAVYFSISLRPPERRHCYRAPSGFNHDTAGHSSVAIRSKALSQEAFPKPPTFNSLPCFIMQSIINAFGPVLI